MSQTRGLIYRLKVWALMEILSFMITRFNPVVWACHGCWRGQFGHADAGLFRHNIRTLYAAAVWMPHNELCMNILGSWHKKFAIGCHASPHYCLCVINWALAWVAGVVETGLTYTTLSQISLHGPRWRSPDWANWDSRLIVSTEEVNRQIRYWDMSLFL